MFGFFGLFGRGIHLYIRFHAVHVNVTVLHGHNGRFLFAAGRAATCAEGDRSRQDERKGQSKPFFLHHLTFLIIKSLAVILAEEGRKVNMQRKYEYKCTRNSYKILTA